MKKDKVKKDKIPFKVLWANPFYSSLIKLGLWVLFFLILYVVLMIGSMNKPINKNNQKKEEKSEKILSLIDMKKNLINKNQKITYSVLDYYITGIISNNSLVGTLEDNEDKIIKFEYDGENIYQVKKDEKIVNDELIVDINKDYLLPSKIINIVDNPDVIGIKSADELCYTYTIDNKSISFYLNKQRIEKIIILDGDITYNLEYEEVVNEE